jgi:hypothetical protein
MRCWPLLLTPSLALILLAGCGGQSGIGTSVTPPETYPNLSGNWTVVADSNLTSTAYLLGGYMTNSDASVTATLQVFPDESDCFQRGGPITFTGKITTTGAISLTSSPVASQTISLAGTVLGNGLLTGTYKVAGGCAAGDNGGVFGESVPSYTGTYNGTFQPDSGSAINVSLALTQSGPFANGEFNVSGTAAFSGSSCFTKGTITSSTVLGEFVQVAMSTDNGGAVQFTALAVATPQVIEIEGPYQVTAGPCAGTSGIINVAS